MKCLGHRLDVSIVGVFLEVRIGGLMLSIVYWVPKPYIVYWVARCYVSFIGWLDADMAGRALYVCRAAP